MLAFDCTSPTPRLGEGPPLPDLGRLRAAPRAAPLAPMTPTPLLLGRALLRRPAQLGPLSDPRVGPRAPHGRGPRCKASARRRHLSPDLARSVLQLSSSSPLPSCDHVSRLGPLLPGQPARPVPAVPQLPHGCLGRLAMRPPGRPLPPLPLPRACRVPPRSAPAGQPRLPGGGSPPAPGRGGGGLYGRLLYLMYGLVLCMVRGPASPLLSHEAPSHLRFPCPPRLLPPPSAPASWSRRHLGRVWTGDFC